jgi:excisionase family DNA binding protein
VDKLALRIPEAVKASGIGCSKLYAESAAGRLESIAVGRRRLVTKAALEQYIETLRVEQNRNGQ